MSVIAELRVAADVFELGRVLRPTRDATVVLETMVPLGRRIVPFFRVHEGDRDAFEARVTDDSSVEALRLVDRQNGEALYALEWDTSGDRLFAAIAATEGQLLSAKGTATQWEFELRFPSHEALARFHERCEDAGIELSVERIFNPSKPGSDPWYGLTPQQRETLIRAVNDGYYSIPRGVSTVELAEVFDISDQAVTERLRRAIATLVEHTLMTDHVSDDGD